MRSIINRGISDASPSKKRGRSLANIALHLPDIAHTDVSSLCRAISIELGQDIARDFGKRLHQAFRENIPIVSSKVIDVWAAVDPPPTPHIDARYIIATYNAAISAGSAFYNPRRLLIALLGNFVQDSEVCTTWCFADVLGVVSIASITDDERTTTAGILKESILSLLETKRAPHYVTEELLCQALTPSILNVFRDQVLSKSTSTQRLKVLAQEEVGMFCSLVP